MATLIFARPAASSSEKCGKLGGLVAAFCLEMFVSVLEVLMDCVDWDVLVTLEELLDGHLIGHDVTVDFFLER